MRHERSQGAQYSWVVRARFDSQFKAQFPPLAEIESRFPDGPIIAARQRDQRTRASYDGGANPFSAEISDHFAMMARRHAPVYFGLALMSPLWCNRSEWTRRGTEFCGWRRWSGPECLLAVHLASHNVTNASLADVFLARWSDGKVPYRDPHVQSLSDLRFPMFNASDTQQWWRA